MYSGRVVTAHLESLFTNRGRNLVEASNEQPVLLVFLRHFGCVFCKEALTDLANVKPELDRLGVHLVFVHMAAPEVAESYFTKFKVGGVEHISDPSKEVYQLFGLMRGNFSQLFGLSTWMRGFKLQTEGYELELNSRLGDSFQMPGIFVLQQGVVKYEYVHERAADRPDYLHILQEALVPA